MIGRIVKEVKEGNGNNGKETNGEKLLLPPERKSGAGVGGRQGAPAESSERKHLRYPDRPAKYSDIHQEITRKSTLRDAQKIRFVESFFFFKNNY